MSFDLSIFAREGGISLRGFEAMFAGRAHYTVANGQAIYENADTGVYFLFEHVEPGPDEGPEALAEEPRLGEPHIAFALNYFRPDVFGIEAAIELGALLGGRDHVIFDPQGGETLEAFDSSAFLERWRHGNAASVPIMREQNIPREPAQPLATGEAVWRWNYGRAGLQDQVGEDLFVPVIMYFQPADGTVRRCFVWTLSIPTVVPDAADSVLIMDDRSKPGLLARLTGKGDKPRMIGIAPISAILGLPEPVPGHSGLTFLTAPPFGVVELIAREARDPHQRLATEQVHDDV